MMHVDLSLVVPVYHCAGRLDGSLAALEAFLDAAPVACELVLVNDRGTDASAGRLLRAFATRRDVRLLENDRNRGKGYSVRRGMLAAAGRHRVFTDVDLAYPLDEIWSISSALARGADVAIACRVLGRSCYEMSAACLKYLYTRHLMSRVFNRLVRCTLLPGVLDTQAGLKGYTARATREVFSRVRIAGFGFDLECLYVARRLGFRMKQVPVRFRYDDEPSTVRFVRDAGTMAADLVRIRWRALAGAYDIDTLQTEPSALAPGAEVSIFQA